MNSRIIVELNYLDDSRGGFRYSLRLRVFSNYYQNSSKKLIVGNRVFYYLQCKVISKLL